MSEWKEYKLGEFINFNPTERLPKGTMSKKIAMEVLQPFTKKISTYSLENYNGGVKFRNGDTIMARITPSLENGKTSFVDVLEDDEVGYGSTEFIVCREIKNTSDKHFIYYLLTTPEIRDVAIMSMTGSSGRQRVQTDVLLDYEITLPALTEQRAITSILSGLDDKINLLYRQNETLDKMAETLFRQWFVEEADESWEETSLKDIVELVIDNRGKTPPTVDYHTEYPLIEVNAINTDSCLVNYDVIRKYILEETYNTFFRKHLQKNDIIISTVGTIGVFSIFQQNKGAIAQNLIGLRFQRNLTYFIFNFLKVNKENILNLDIGGVL